MEKHVNYVLEIHKPVLNQDTLLQEHTKFHWLREWLCHLLSLWLRCHVYGASWWSSNHLITWQMATSIGLGLVWFLEWCTLAGQKYHVLHLLLTVVEMSSTSTKNDLISWNIKWERCLEEKRSHADSLFLVIWWHTVINPTWTSISEAHCSHFLLKMPSLVN